MKRNNVCFSLLVPSISPGPCSPSNVSVSTECGASTVSWSNVSGVDKYIATATAHDGHSKTCNSTSANSCSFFDLQCGENYSVSVVAVDRDCHSGPSSTVQLKTGEKTSIKDSVIYIKCVNEWTNDEDMKFAAPQSKIIWEINFKQHVIVQLNLILSWHLSPCPVTNLQILIMSIFILLRNILEPSYSVDV